METSKILSSTLLFFLIISSTTPLAFLCCRSDVHSTSLIKEMTQLSFENSMITVATHEDGSALVVMTLLPSFVEPYLPMLNISIPYSITQLQSLPVLQSPPNWQYNFSFTENETVIHVQNLISGTPVRVVYQVYGVTIKNEFSWRFSMDSHVEQLSLTIEIPQNYKIVYSTIDLDPPPSLLTYHISTQGLLSPSRLMFEMNDVEEVPVTVDFNMGRVNLLLDLLYFTIVSAFSIGMAWLVMFMRKAYHQILNLTILSLKNIIRRGVKTTLTIFGVTSLVSLISMVLLSTQVIGSIVLSSLGEEHFLKIGPHLSLIIIITTVIGGFLVLETIFSSVYTRRQEIGIMKAIGYSGSRISKMIVIESVLVGLLSGVAGTFIGTLFSIWKYVAITTCLQGTPITMAEGLLLLAFFIGSFVVSVSIGKRYDQLFIAVIVEPLTFLIQYLVLYLIQPYVRIPLIEVAPLLLRSWALTITLTVLMTALAGIYPAYIARRLKTIDMIRKA